MSFTVIAGWDVVVIVTVNPANHRHKISNETWNFALHHDTVAANRIHIVSFGFVWLNHNWKHCCYLFNIILSAENKGLPKGINIRNVANEL